MRRVVALPLSTRILHALAAPAPKAPGSAAVKARVPRTQRFGTFALLTLFAWMALAPGSAQALTQQIIDQTGDSAGNTFSAPRGIAVDNFGNVYVAGRDSDNVFRFSLAGFITEIIDATGDGGGNILNGPARIAVDGSGNVYVTGFDSNNAFKIATPGACKTSGGTLCTITEIIDATGDGGGNTLDNTSGIAVDGSGNVYVTGQISDNAFKIATPGTCKTSGGTPCTITEIIDASGGLGGILNGPSGIAVDGDGDVYVAGALSDNAFRIQSGIGIFEIIDATGDGGGNILDQPLGIAVDGSRNAYVTGGNSDNVFKIPPNFVVTEIIDATGDGGGNTLDGPFGIAVDGSGNVYFTGFGSNNAFMIPTPGTCKTSGGTPCTIAEIIDATGGLGGILTQPGEIAVGGSGNVYVTGETSDNAFEIGRPDLSVTQIDSSDPVVVGESFTYTVTATNNDGRVLATNVVLTNTLPAGISLVSTTGCAEDPAGAPTCTLGILTPGGSRVVTLTVDANVDGLATNSATVSADGTDPIPANDTANETTLLIVDELTWFFSGTASGGTIDFMVNGVNLGGQPTAAGQSAAQVAAAIAARINGNPALTAAGIGAVVDGDSVITNGVVTDTVINDAGLTHISCAARITEIIDTTGDGGGSSLFETLGMAVDGSGNVYVTGETSDNVFKIKPGGVITEIIDGAGDGVHSLDLPLGIAVDSADNVYVTGGTSSNVFKITPGGVKTEIIDATGDRLGHSFLEAGFIAVDGSDNVYVIGRNSDNAFKIDTPGACKTSGGTLCTITEIIDNEAGDGPGGKSLDLPVGIAVDGSGNVYVGGLNTDNVFKITPGGMITEIIDGAGDGPGGNILDATGEIAVDGSGNVYVGGRGSNNVFQITMPGTCSTGGTLCTITEIIDATGDGGGNTFVEPFGIAVDGSGNVYVSGVVSDNAFKIATPGPCKTSGGTLCTITEIIDTAGDGGGNTLDKPLGIAVDGSGTVYIAAGNSSNAFKIIPEPVTEIIDATGAGGALALNEGRAIAVDGSGNIYVTGETSDNVFKITPGSVITEIIDDTGDGVNSLDLPLGIAVDSADNVYVAGGLSNNAFRITPGGLITEIIDDEAGDGPGGNIFIEPGSIAVDGADNVYVIGRNSDNAFKIDTPGACKTSGGTLCTITEIIDAEAGDGPGGKSLDLPVGIAVDGSDNVYVGGSNTDNAFKITPGGMITEIIDADGDDGPGGNILDATGEIAVDGSGNVYVGGGGSDNVFQITIPGTCSTGGTACMITEIIDATGDGGGNTFDEPNGIAVDGAGNVYVSGVVSDNAFKITPGGVVTQIINAIGDSCGNILDKPLGIAVDDASNVYVAAGNSSNAFKITPTSGSAQVPAGMNLSGILLGGASVPGGIDFTFDDATGGTLSAGYVLTPVSNVDQVVSNPGSINFGLPTDPLQLWELIYTGTFTGDLTLTIGYDDTNLAPGFTEADFGVYHFTGGIWVKPPQTIDTVNNTITVTVAGLSQFILGAAIETSGAWGFSGTAQGGTIDFTVGAVLLSVTTTNGQTAAQVATAVAAAINADPTLSAGGVTATVSGNLVTVDGGVITATAINDAGIGHQAIGIPALSPVGVGLFLLLLAGGALLARRRHWGQA